MRVGTAINPQSAVLFVSLANIARARKDVPPLLIDTDLVVAVGDAHGTETIDNKATALAAALSADPIESSWTHAGKFSGSAPSVVKFLDALLASRDHRALLLDADFTRIGVVVQLDDDRATVQVVLTDGPAPAHHPLD